jgi:hypothetical protein
VTIFHTIEKTETEFGTNNFLEIARKVAYTEDGKGETEFISITLGYLDTHGCRRYKTNLTVPPDPELVAFLARGLEDVTDEDLEAVAPAREA